ncbi:MAG: DUF5666 domain-containing protein [Gammaproteobacteria bacterium]|nr:DUF5666 domain-containing protein [Gammaproteobacteria bacterium]
MTFKHTGLFSALLAASMGMAGCSGSGTTSSAADVTGRITGFGSVYVNGVEYETAGTNIVIDGVPATEADLAVGMLVTLNGSDNGSNGNATSISFNDNLEGAVTQTVAGGGLQVMGYNITANTLINFDNMTDTNGDNVITLDDLLLGDIVEISGYSDGLGGIQATYIEINPAGGELEVKGVVANLTATTFTIGSMTVDYSSANPADVTILTDGMFVEVKGDTAPVGNIFTATKVEVEEHDVDGNDGDELEVEGLIAAIDINSTPNTITIGDQSFNLPAGFDLGNFAVGDMVELEINVVGTELVVSEIEDEDHDDDNPGKIEAEASVTSTDTVNNTISLAGLTISVNPNTTIMIDYSALSEHYFNLGSIQAGDRVEVKAIPDGQGGYVAISIERQPTSTSTTVELEGPVVNGVLSFPGITLDLSAVDTSVLTSASKAHVNGSFAAGTLTVTSLEAE